MDNSTGPACPACGRTFADEEVPGAGDGHFVMIPLTQGKFTLVDEEDAELILSMGKWHAFKRSHIYYAAHTESRTRRTIFMHWLVTGHKRPDHANRNGLDNRRVNLRVATEVQNLVNKGLSRRNTSGYKGVRWVEERGKWMAYIGIDRRRRYLGAFGNPVDAARAYNRAALEAWGEFAWLNPLPETTPAAAPKRRDRRLKLTAEIVRQSRERHASGESFRSIARGFGVSGPTIARAVNGVNWRHVA